MTARACGCALALAVLAEQTASAQSHASATLVLTSAAGHETVVVGTNGVAARRLLIVSDREGSQYSSQWVTALRAIQPTPSLIEVAHLRGVPALVRPLVRRGFRNAGHVLLDWHGQIATRYGFDDNAVNVYVLDGGGRLLDKVSGRAPDGTLAEFVRRVRALESTP